MGFSRDVPSGRCTSPRRPVVCFRGKGNGPIPLGPTSLTPWPSPDFFVASLRRARPFPWFRFPAQLFGGALRHLTVPSADLEQADVVGRPSCKPSVYRVDKGRLSTGDMRRSVPATPNPAGRPGAMLRAAPRAPPSTPRPPGRTSRTLGSRRSSSRRRRRATPPRGTWSARNAHGSPVASFDPRLSFP